MYILPMNDEVIVTRTKWDPSPAEMDAYLKREVEMARENLARLGPNGAAFTLHSQRTLNLASSPKP